MERISKSLINFTPDKKNSSKKLFCFAHAGGGASFFKNLANTLKKVDIEVIAIQLPGRENRIKEKPYENLQDIVNSLYNEILSYLKEKQSSFYFFGHSMGSLVCYELSLYMFKKKSDLPQHLFLSSFSSPNNQEYTKKYLNNSDVIAKLRDLNGTPLELLEDKDFLEIFLPAVKADFNIVNSYQEHGEFFQIPIPITVLFGTKDIISVEDILDWKLYTSKNFSYQIFNGDHFYINKNIENIRKIIKRL